MKKHVRCWDVTRELWRLILRYWEVEPQDNTQLCWHWYQHEMMQVLLIGEPKESLRTLYIVMYFHIIQIWRNHTIQNVGFVGPPANLMYLGVVSQSLSSALALTCSSFIADSWDSASLTLSILTVLETVLYSQTLSVPCISTLALFSRLLCRPGYYPHDWPTSLAV